jgi:hypothetical protein
MDLTVALLAAVAVLALALLGGAVLHVRRLRRQLGRQEAVLLALERDLQAVCTGARGMGEVVSRLEDRLRRLTERQDELTLREPGHEVYHQAIRLTHRGASVEELVATCGLPRGEAELIHILHRNGRAASPEASAGGLRARA